MSAIRTAGTAAVLGVCAVIACAVMAGCAEPTARLNAPPQGHTCCPHEMQRFYTPMVDNEMLADMSMSPADFVPHQPELNTKGVRRLSRYASILETYGGTLNYDGVSDPEPLANERLARMESFLVAAGVDRDRFTVARGLAGGTGLMAIEAMAARKQSLVAESKAQPGGPAAAVAR